MSSSISGQWTPSPDPIISKRLRCDGVAWANRHDQDSGTLIVRPSASWRGGVLVKAHGGSIPEEWRNEYVSDRVHTLGTAILGLTVECCRCHDHKYDPISQREFYQLFSFFNNVDERGTIRGASRPASPVIAATRSAQSPAHTTTARAPTSP